MKRKKEEDTKLSRCCETEADGYEERRNKKKKTTSGKTT
jgi:hypothetical protein